MTFNYQYTTKLKKLRYYTFSGKKTAIHLKSQPTSPFFCLACWLSTTIDHTVTLLFNQGTKFFQVEILMYTCTPLYLLSQLEKVS